MGIDAYDYGVADGIKSERQRIISYLLEKKVIRHALFLNDLFVASTVDEYKPIDISFNTTED